MTLGVYGNPKAFKDVYFPTPGYYLTGDGAYRDKDGYFWITGRIDDVMNVSGHRIGTAEVESALVAHPLVAEAAVVGYPHPVKGEGIYAYVTVKEGAAVDDDLRTELVRGVRTHIGRDSDPRRDPLRPRAAEDAQRKDHAAYPAQDSRPADRGSVRRLHAFRAFSGRRAHQGKRATGCLSRS